MDVRNSTPIRFGINSFGLFEYGRHYVGQKNGEKDEIRREIEWGRASCGSFCYRLIRSWKKLIRPGSTALILYWICGGMYRKEVRGRSAGLWESTVSYSSINKMIRQDTIKLHV